MVEAIDDKRQWDNIDDDNSNGNHDRGDVSANNNRIYIVEENEDIGNSSAVQHNIVVVDESTEETPTATCVALSASAGFTSATTNPVLDQASQKTATCVLNLQRILAPDLRSNHHHLLLLLKDYPIQNFP